MTLNAVFKHQGHQSCPVTLILTLPSIRGPTEMTTTDKAESLAIYTAGESPIRTVQYGWKNLSNRQAQKNVYGQFKFQLESLGD